MNFIGNILFLKGHFNKRWTVRLARALVVAMACVLVASPSMADTWDDVVAADQAGNYARAFRPALELASAGDARAQGLVGFFYINGLGVEEDADQALHWYRLASDQGDAGAQANLCAALSAGSTADLNEAAHWCRLSAAQNYDAGLYHPGLLYFLGLGVERSMPEAYVWLSFAELKARHPDMRSDAAKLKALAIKELTVAELAEADRRVSAWKSAQP